MHKFFKTLTVFVTIIMIFSMLFTTGGVPAAKAAPPVPVSFTILHTNDFHGQLEPAGSNPGMARAANFINTVRTAVGDANVLLVDAGDEMQGSLLSNLGDGTATGKGIPTIDTFNTMSYDVATFGNHEFDWGQVNLANRTTEALYPYVTANIVQNDTGNCATAGWTPPAFADAPYQILEVGVAPNSVKVAFIGVTTTETPTITVASATAGLCFKDPTASILQYYDAMKAAGADVIVVLSHLGFTDGGYGYGLPVTGDQTLAANLNTAGKPVNLIIGGHSHTDVGGPAPAPGVATVGTTKVVQAHYNGRKVGRADITVGTDGSVAVTWTRNVIGTSDPQDPTVDALIDAYASDPDYLALVNTPVGYSSVDLPRFGGTADNMMATFIDDAIYDYLNSDAESANDVDIFFNNAGGIRTDWCWSGSDWINTGCVGGTHSAGLLTYGDMFTVLPFGNATAVGLMTGEKILEVLNYSPNVVNGVIQPAGLKFSYFKYSDTNPGPQPYAWGAYDITVYNKGTTAWEPLDLTKTYKVGTNEFLAPAGGDGYSGFKYMTGITYWGDMLNAVNAFVAANYGTEVTSYLGPNGDGTLDGRIGLTGDGDTVYDAGEIVPLTILHHNDSHGNLAKGAFVGYTQLATLIKQERLHNPTRTLLLSSGDNIQGDAMSYYFKTAPTGVTSDGTVIADSALHIQPLIKTFNSMDYDAWVLGNHEFNFGKDVFTSVLDQATFPLLQANLTDDGSYGLATAGIMPYVERDLGDIDVAILGIGNHRVPNYELPSNIPGLTFTDPIAKAQELSTLLGPTNDVVVALTHIGFTENPASVEVDANVDTNLVATVTGLDALVGGHSHTNPASGFGAYKYLPSIVVDPDGKPVIVGHAYRYNNTLGELSLGLRPLGGGDYEVVSQTGRYLSVSLSGTAEDAATKAIVDPYVALLNTYNNTTVGDTTAPIDTMLAFTQETNGANLQADAAVYELSVKHSIPVDFHLSGAMTNKLIATTATPSTPYTLKVSDMFSAMPYENSLVVMEMNGPQLKAVLERAYRNYYYYKYVTGYGGYSYYTTCMLVTDSGNQITYNDLNPALPSGNNVVSLKIGGVPVDFSDAATYYNVSTVNYLAAGSCNFNDAGVTLWPLSQIVADTQYYVRDAVIDYTTFMGTVSPAIEGRVNFDITPPELTITGATADGVDMAGDLATGFILPTTNISTIDHLIQFKAGTTADETLASDYFGLKLINSTVTPAEIKAYYAARGVPEPFLTYLNGAADGTNPFVYIKGSTVKLVDAAKHDLLGSDVDMTIPDDFPLGTYTVEGKIKDLAGNETTVTLKLIVAGDRMAPVVDSVNIVSASPTSLASVDYTVTFSEFVTGVDATDFDLTTTGSIAAVSLSGVVGSGTTYTVSVNTGTGNGTIRLDVLNDSTIVDEASNPLTAGFTNGETYFMIRSASFIDVPLSYWASSWIERLYNAGLTAGCSGPIPLFYCPDQAVTRAQMAVFLERGMNGSSYTPPAATGMVFGDVPVSYWSASWIEKLYADGITNGCGLGNYCPDQLITRAQIAVFLLRAKHGSSYTPPAATGVFPDVPTSYWAARWIEQLYAEGITGGCGGGNYCPDQAVTRAQMAVFLVRTFNLP